MKDKNPWNLVYMTLQSLICISEHTLSLNASLPTEANLEQDMSGLNAPAPDSAFRLGDNEKKVEFVEDTKIPNAATFTFNKEDHTLAGLLKSQLLLNSHVLFAGYKVPHPLEARFVMSLQTDGSITPFQAMTAACNSALATFREMKIQFAKESHMYDDAADGTFVGIGEYGVGE